MGVRRALEDRGQELCVGDVLGARQVLGHLLVDRAALALPQFWAGQDAAHPDRLDVQRDVQILGGNGEDVLGQPLLGGGVEHPPHGGGDGRQLVGREVGAAAEHHVLEGVRHAREARGGLGRAHQIGERGGDHGGERVPDDDHAQAVVEGRAQDAGGAGRVAADDGAPRRTEEARREPEHGPPPPPACTTLPSSDCPHSAGPVSIDGHALSLGPIVVRFSGRTRRDQHARPRAARQPPAFPAVCPIWAYARAPRGRA